MDSNTKKVGIAVAAIFGLYLVFVGVSSLFGSGEAQRQQTQFSGVELTFWHVYDTSDTMRPLLDAFSARTGMQVNYRSFTDMGLYRETLLTELAAGEGPDILAFHPTWLEKYKKILAPMPAADLGFDIDSVRREFVDTVALDMIDTYTTGDGRRAPIVEVTDLYGLPMYVDSLALIYNSALFKQVAAKPTGQPELDWVGVRNDAMNLTAYDAASGTFSLSGLAAGRVDNVSRGAELFWTLWMQNGGADLRDARGNIRLGQTGSEAFDFFTRFARDPELAEFMWDDTLGQEPEKEIADFARGRVAMIAGYSYYLDEIQNLVTQYQRSRAGGVVNMSDVGVQTLPQLGGQGAARVSLADYFALGVAAGSDEPHAAWQLILYLTSPDAAQEYLNSTGKPAARSQLLVNQQRDATLRPWAEQAVYARSMPMADDQIYREALTLAVSAIVDDGMQPARANNAFEKYLSCRLANEPVCSFQ